MSKLDFETTMPPRDRVAAESDANARGASALWLAEAEALRAQMRGRVVAPGDARWDSDRQAFNLTLDQRPQLIAFPASLDDVRAAVRFAASRGLCIAPQRTGHRAAPLGPLAGAVLVNLAALDEVTLDAATRRARVGAGALWQDVVPRASELGLAALHGSTPHVGIAGYSLGGGLGWYTRKHGLATNRLTAIELVSTDGELLRADHDHDADLFWALRGGGGEFGVVTALEFELLSIREVYAGALFFPIDRASEVLHAWREWTGTAPEEITSVGRLLRLPQLPQLPDALRGRSFALVEAVCLLHEHAASASIAPLRALGPAIDTFATVPPAGITGLHMDPVEPVPYATQHKLLTGLPETAIEAMLAAAGPDSGCSLLSVELRHLGGACARAAADGGVLDSIDARFVEFAVGLAVDSSGAATTKTHLAALDDALAPFDSGRRYLNFEEERCAPTAFFDETTLARLRSVKQQLDPRGLVRPGLWN